VFALCVGEVDRERGGVKVGEREPLRPLGEWAGSKMEGGGLDDVVVGSVESWGEREEGGGGDAVPTMEPRRRVAGEGIAPAQLVGRGVGRGENTHNRHQQPCKQLVSLFPLSPFGNSDLLNICPVPSY
jgi:hypothetical protein